METHTTRVKRLEWDYEKRPVTFGDTAADAAVEVVRYSDWGLLLDMWQEEFPDPVQRVGIVSILEDVGWLDSSEAGDGSMEGTILAWLAERMKPVKLCSDDNHEHEAYAWMGRACESLANHKPHIYEDAWTTPTEMNKFIEFVISAVR